MQDKTQITAAHQQVTAGHDQEFREELGKTCMDGGTCHHKEICTESCFRRECCQPLTQAMNAGLTMQQWRYPRANQLHELESIAQRYAHEFENAGRETYGEDAEKAARKAKTKLTAALTDFLGKIAAPQAAPAAVAVPDAVRDAEKLLRAEAARLDRIYGAGKWYGFSAEKASHLEHLRVADALAATPAAVPTYIEVRECSECGHIGINDADGSKAACSKCDWQGDSPVEDKCPDCNTVGTMTAACSNCGARASLLAETTLHAEPIAPAAAAPVVLPEPWGYLVEGRIFIGRLLPQHVNSMVESEGFRPIKLFTEQQLRALLATATGLPAQAVPLKLIEAINTACGGGNEWQGDALAPDLLEPACRAITSLAPQAQAVPAFCHVASLKLKSLQGRGYQITGYALEKPVKGAQPERGFINHGGFVGWWWDGQSPLVQPGALDALTSAARDVLAERARQISSEGWTPGRDDEYRGEELALGAAWYATPTFTRNTLDANDMSLWPVSWADSWFKPGDRRRELTKAGALVLAEIERIDRAAIAAAKGESNASN